MQGRVWLECLPPVQAADLQGLLDLASKLDIDLRVRGARDGEPGPAALASAGEHEREAGDSAVITALGLDNGLWLFWSDAGRIGRSVGRGSDQKGGLRVGRFSAIFAWPRDRDQLERWLLRGMTVDSFSVPVDDRHALDESAERFETSLAEIGLIGRSPRFRDALCLVARLARYDVPVLLEGETGTGKELFARALHYAGPRRARPFVPLNCGALPDALLESQLFGHMRGAFTDARAEMRGLVAQAEGGTLFFDEVHCLSPKGQVTLLRFVQDQLYRPLGCQQLRRADVRIVAATNCSLAREVADGRFREDLFYRLKVASLRLPPLRERREDIPLLVDAAIARLCARFHVASRSFDVASMAWLATRDWHGNIRELENVVCREFLLTDDDVIHMDPRLAEAVDEPSGSPSAASYRDAKAQVLAEFETRYLRTMLALTHGNVSEAARQAGKERRVFGRMMRRLGIDRHEFG